MLSTGFNRLYRGSLLQNIHILLIESELAIADPIAFLLKAEGARVQVIDGVEKALNVVQKVRPDVILCNVTLHDGDGYSFIKQVRQLEGEQRVVHLSNKNGVQAIAFASCSLLLDRQQVISSGFHDCLLDPMEHSSLIEAIFRLIKQNLSSLVCCNPESHQKSTASIPDGVGITSSLHSLAGRGDAIADGPYQILGG